MTQVAAEDWRELSGEFAKLAQEESKELGPGSHPYIDAYVHDLGNGRHWTVVGRNNNRVARFGALASRAVRLNEETPHRGDLVDAWLERLCLDLLQQRDEGATVNNLRFAQKPGDNCIIDCVCLESATFCARLEAQAHTSAKLASPNTAPPAQPSPNSVQVAIDPPSKGQSGQSETTPDSEQGPKGSTFSDDFRSVFFAGENHLLTTSQASMCKVLWQALKKGHPAVGKESLLSNTQSSEVRDTWKKSDLWNKLIVSKKRGTYQLNPLFFSREVARNPG